MVWHEASASPREGDPEGSRYVEGQTLGAESPLMNSYEQGRYEVEMRYFEDFQIGDKIVTRGRTITEADIVMFSAFSGDWHPLHTDVEYAKQGPFGERIAHGFLVLSVASGLLPLSEIAIIAFYGMDKVRFVGPVKLMDTIHVEFETVDKQDRDEQGGVITFQQTVKNQRGEDVVVATMRSFVAKRGAG